MQYRILLFLLCFGCASSYAQAPYQFSFQGIATDDNSQPVQSAAITVRITIIQNQLLGPVVFQEIHPAQTDVNGLFTIIVGSAGGDLSKIEWPYDIFFIKTEVDHQNNGKFHFVGASQLLSLPYSLYANEAGALRTNFPILQKDDALQSADLPIVGFGPRLIWHPKKAAFRVGLTNNGWEDSNIGDGSFAAGLDPQASGYGSVAIGTHSVAAKLNAVSLGNLSHAEEDHSFSIGNKCYAYNHHSFAIGNWAAAMGDYSISLGHHTVAKAPHSLAVGLYNNSLDQPNGGPTDRIFQIGNGTDINLRNNALTVLRNGNIGVGGKTVLPEFILDVASRMRIRNDGSTAGLYLNNSQNKPEGFVGMKTDKQLGFYLNGAWRFWVDDMGTAWIPSGALQAQASDKRLKKDIVPLEGSLNAISQMRGYHYYWTDAGRGTELQTGVIAQEVEKYFPELVQENEKGFKTVNYTGLIPHLIESVRELKNQTAEIAELRKEINELKMLTGNRSYKNVAPQNSSKAK